MKKKTVWVLEGWGYETHWRIGIYAKRTDVWPLYMKLRRLSYRVKKARDKSVEEEEKLLHKIIVLDPKASWDGTISYSLQEEEVL